MQVVRCGRFVFSFVVCGFVELSALFDKIHGERTEQRDISLVFFFLLSTVFTRYSILYGHIFLFVRFIRRHYLIFKSWLIFLYSLLLDCHTVVSFMSVSSKCYTQRCA